MLNLLSVRKYTGTRIDIVQTIVKPLFSSVIMGLAAWGTHRLLIGFLGNALSTVAGIGAGVIVYVLMALSTETLTIKELEAIPKAEKLVKLAKILSRPFKKTEK